MWLATGLEVFFPETSVSSTNKTDRHDIAEILLKVALSTIKANIYDMARSHEGRDDKRLWLVINPTTIRSRTQCTPISHMIMTFDLKVK
jgi:hypothetical protein